MGPHDAVQDSGQVSTLDNKAKVNLIPPGVEPDDEVKQRVNEV